MRRVRNLVAIGAFSFLVLGIPAIAFAQNNGQYDPYSRNGGYNNGGYNNGGYDNGQYGNSGSGDIRSAVRELKDLSKRFEKDLDRSPIYSKNNGGRYGNYGGYNNGNDRGSVRKLADKFGDAASDLEKSFGNGRYNNNSQNQANQVLSLGSQLDNQLRQYGLDNYLQTDWNRIQYDLRIVSNNLSNGNYRNNRNNGGYNNGGNNNGTWNNGRRPSWWPF